MLTQAMDRNLGVIALKAKVALAEAELRSARLEVARQLIALRAEEQIQTRAAELARTQIKRVEQKSRQGQAAGDEMDVAKNALIDAQARLSRTEMELRFLIGKMPPGVSAAVVQSAPLQVPQGPVADAIRKATDAIITLEFMEAPMKSALEFIQQSGKIAITVDWGCPIDPEPEGSKAECCSSGDRGSQSRGSICGAGLRTSADDTRSGQGTRLSAIGGVSSTGQER
jgi:hypothetical protein